MLAATPPVAPIGTEVVLHYAGSFTCCGGDNVLIYDHGTHERVAACDYATPCAPLVSHPEAGTHTYIAYLTTRYPSGGYPSMPRPATT